MQTGTPDTAGGPRRFAQAAWLAMLTLASSGLFVASFQPHALRLFAWVALVPFLVAVDGRSPKTATALGALWGMASAYGITDWLPPAVATYYRQPVWMGVSLFAAAAFAMGGVYYMAFATLYRTAAAANVRALPMLAGAAWVAAEFGRARVLTGNPWGLLGYTLSGYSGGGDSLFHHGSNAILQVAGVAGVYGVTFLIVAANVALARLVVSRRVAAVRGRALADAAAVFAFLQKYGLEDEYRLNIEVNHATLAGHSFEHELAYALAHGILGSVDINRGDPQLGWGSTQRVFGRAHGPRRPQEDSADEGPPDD